MQRSLSLKKNAQFAYVHRRGVSQADRRLVLLYAKGSRLLIGFSVSKKLGNAVARNRIKRLLRECVRPCVSGLRRGSYVLIARQGAAGADFGELKQSVLGLLKRAKLYTPPDNV